MIKKLFIENFRRYSDLELNFEEEDQLILISGKNGSGKSTILEAIIYALYGEGRNGRRNLGNLIKRGEEIDGLTVELTFLLGGEVIRIHRKRNKSGTSALLYINDNPIVEGASDVTSEVTRLLGMDVFGFRLAVIAQQKDLEGLVSLRPQERSQMINRLLKLDKIGKAKEITKESFKNEQIKLKQHFAIESSSVIKSQIEILNDEISLSSKQVSDSLLMLENLKVSLAKYPEINERYHALLLDKNHLETIYQKSIEDLKLLEDELGNLKIPSLTDEPALDIQQYSNDVVENENAIFQAELTQSKNARGRLLQAEILEEEAELLTLQERAAMLTTDYAEEELANYRSQEKLNQTVKIFNEANGKKATLLHQISIVSISIDLLQGSGLTCETCMQPISNNHKENMLKAKFNERDTLTNQLSLLEQELLQREKEIEVLEISLKSTEEKINSLKLNLVKVENFNEKIASKVELIDNLKKELALHTLKEVNIEELYAKKTELALLGEQYQNYRKVYEGRVKVLEKLSYINSQIIQKKEIIEINKNKLENFIIDSHLIEEFYSLQESNNLYQAENELHLYWSNTLATQNANLENLQIQLNKSLKDESERKLIEIQATRFMHVGTILSDLSSKISRDMLPMLENKFSEISALLSNGRFTAAKIYDNYEIKIQDNDKFFDLTEFSGGENDLLALALRLALTQVLSHFHNTKVLGFLILDECFASQDRERRELILNSLKMLKDLYPQIFIVSHIENIEEFADCNINVVSNNNEPEILFTRN